MDNKKRGLLAGGAAVIIIVAAVVAGIMINNRNKAEDTAITAMYVPITDEVYLFVGEEAGGVFTVHFPEEIYDINGKRISKDDLEKGNIVKIYGDGAMAESYPGQYFGVTKMKVIEAGKPEDADKYQSIVDEIYQAPDPSEPPTMNAEYTTDMAVVAVMVNRGGYEWNYMDKDGLSNAVVADSPHVLNWGNQLVDIKLKEPVEITLNFSEEPQEVKVVRYDSAFAGTESEIPQGEEVVISIKDNKYTIPDVTGGYVYEITGIWENGRATYGFLTVS